MLGGGSALQGGAQLIRGKGKFQHGMDGKQMQQLADVFCLAGLLDYDDLRLGCSGLQGAQGDIQIGDRGAGVVVVPAPSNQSRTPPRKK